MPPQKPVPGGLIGQAGVEPSSTVHGAHSKPTKGYISFIALAVGIIMGAVIVYLFHKLMGV